MKPTDVFVKTMPFVWWKLLLGLITVVGSVILFAILVMGFGTLFDSPGVYFFMFLIWLAATGALNFFLNQYLGYLIKAGHVAVITEAVTTGRVPDNQVAYGKQMVKERFLTSNVYFALDKLVAGAVRQLQKLIEKAGGFLGFVPGMKYVTEIMKLFIGIALGYIDECCLGYTFLRKEQGAFKSAADGVVIYYQNVKKLLKDAAVTTAIVVGLMVAAALISWGLFGLLTRAFGWNDTLLGWGALVAFAMACLLAWAIKKSFIDSYMMVKMMVSYMEVAPTTVITFDLYGKLSGLSTKFKELFNKGQSEGGAPVPQPAYAPAANAGKPVFCGACGAQNNPGTKFCGGCGSPLGGST
jgi:hypothetical protein